MQLSFGPLTLNKQEMHLFVVYARTQCPLSPAFCRVEHGVMCNLAQHQHIPLGRKDLQNKGVHQLAVRSIPVYHDGSSLLGAGQTSSTLVML